VGKSWHQQVLDFLHLSRNPDGTQKFDPDADMGDIHLLDKSDQKINPATSENIAALTAAVGLITSAMAPATTFAGGTKTVALTTTPEALVADSTPCKRVWIGPRVNADGVPQNTKPVFIGDTASQNVPITVANLEGMVFSIDNAAKLFVKVGVDGEGVEYRIIA